jgi:hypothetical protein
MTPPRSLRPVAFALGLIVAVATPGCMQSETKTTVLADGSGTASDVMTIDIAKTKTLFDTLKAFGMGGAPGGGAGGIPADFDVEKMIEAEYAQAKVEKDLKAVPGVEVKSVTSEAKDGKRIVRREFAFAGFDALGAAAFQTTSAQLKKNDDGSFTLEMDAIGPLRPMLSMGGEAAGAFDPQAMMGMVAEMVGDFRMKRTFTLPGTIVSTNGTKAEDGKTVTWSFAIEDLKNATADPKNAPGKMNVTFKGEGLMLKPFEYAPSMADIAKRMQPADAAAPSKPGEAPAGGETKPAPAGGEAKPAPGK